MDQPEMTRPRSKKRLALLVSGFAAVAALVVGSIVVHGQPSLPPAVVQALGPAAQLYSPGSRVGAASATGGGSIALCAQMNAQAISDFTVATAIPPLPATTAAFSFTQQHACTGNLVVHANPLIQNPANGVVFTRVTATCLGGGCTPGPAIVAEPFVLSLLPPGFGIFEGSSAGQFTRGHVLGTFFNLPRGRYTISVDLAALAAGPFFLGGAAYAQSYGPPTATLP